MKYQARYINKVCFRNYTHVSRFLLAWLLFGHGMVYPYPTGFVWLYNNPEVSEVALKSTGEYIAYICKNLWPSTNKWGIDPWAWFVAQAVYYLPNFKTIVIIRHLMTRTRIHELGQVSSICQFLNRIHREQKEIGVIAYGVSATLPCGR